MLAYTAAKTWGLHDDFAAVEVAWGSATTDGTWCLESSILDTGSGLIVIIPGCVLGVCILLDPDKRSSVQSGGDGQKMFLIIEGWGGATDC